MENKSNKKTKEIDDSEAMNKRFCEPQSKLRDKSSNCIENIESEKSSKTSKNPLSLNGKMASVLSIAEKTIKELYDTTIKKITNFVTNDLRELKNLSKDELTKLNASLSEYKRELEKLSQVKIKSISEMKKKLQTRIITAEELQHFVKYFDDRIVTLKRATENVVNTLRKSEVANTFVKDLRTIVTDYGKKMTNVMNDLYNALKEMSGGLSPSVTDKSEEKLTAEIQKIPTTSELQKLPSRLSKMFKNMGTGTTNFKDSGETAKKVLLPITRLRDKMPPLNLSKHFNSETMYGRANVSRNYFKNHFGK